MICVKGSDGRDLKTTSKIQTIKWQKASKNVDRDQHYISCDNKLDLLTDISDHWNYC